VFFDGTGGVDLGMGDVVLSGSWVVGRGKHIFKLTRAGCSPVATLSMAQWLHFCPTVLIVDIFLGSLHSSTAWS
jgi:hypothetical protein